MKIKKILQIIDEFFKIKQLEMNSHIKQYGKGNNRDIDSREKGMLLILPSGYKEKLKKIFIEIGDLE